MRRFVPGETDCEAEVQLYNQIEQSTTSTITYTIIDYFHDKAPLKKLPQKTLKTAQLLVTTLWNVSGLEDTTL